MKVTEPVRATRHYTQRLNASPAAVFPLLCPVREVDWVNGWSPRLVVTASGVVERECVFVMPEEPNDSIWVVTVWKPDDFRVEFVKVTPELAVGLIEIQLRSAGADGTHADVTYSYTALSPAGVKYVESFTEEHYTRFMQEWEAELNYYLEHGSMKPA